MSGPNAFAQEAARRERYRMENNAFYQEEAKKREETPPAALHPTMRTRSASETRFSPSTTMSPLIRTALRQPSPDLRLLPEAPSAALPTGRAQIEEQNKDDAQPTLYRRDGSLIPVFRPTPRIAAEGFGEQTSKKKVPKKVAIREPAKSGYEPKSPTKRIFDRFRISGPGRAQSTQATETLSSFESTRQEDHVPPKAQAVLGESPSKQALLRSPSRKDKKKKKGLFSSRRSDISAVEARRAAMQKDDQHVAPGRTIARSSQSTWMETTPTSSSYSPPLVNRTNIDFQKTIRTFKGKQVMKEKEEEQLIAGVAGSKSLSGIDSVPPTPPLKDTPPQEKALKEEAAARSQSMPVVRATSPPRVVETGRFLSGASVTPSRSNHMDLRRTATLASAPSTHSFRASVIGDVAGTPVYDGRQAQFGMPGFGGFGIRSDSLRHRDIDTTYSPSVYSSEWSNTPGMLTSPGSGAPASSPFLPTLREEDERSLSAKRSGLSAESVPIVYPELAFDPSLNNLLDAQLPHDPVKVNSRGSGPPVGNSLENAKAPLPRNIINPPLRHSSSDFSLFAFPLQEQLRLSPPTFEHPSAAPSPLQMSNTTSNTPSRKTRDKGKGRMQDLDAPGGSGSASDYPAALPRMGEPPNTVQGLFENMPPLPAPTIVSPKKQALPVDAGRKADKHDDTVPDPKQLARMSESFAADSDKLDKILARFGAIENSVRDLREMHKEFLSVVDKPEDGTAEGPQSSPKAKSTQSSAVDASVSSAHEPFEGITKALDTFNMNMQWMEEMREKMVKQNKRIEKRLLVSKYVLLEADEAQKVAKDPNYKRKHIEIPVVSEDEFSSSSDESEPSKHQAQQEKVADDAPKIPEAAPPTIADRPFKIDFPLRMGAPASVAWHRANRAAAVNVRGVDNLYPAYYSNGKQPAASAGTAVPKTEVKRDDPERARAGEPSNIGAHDDVKEWLEHLDRIEGLAQFEAEARVGRAGESPPLRTSRGRGNVSPERAERQASAPTANPSSGGYPIRIRAPEMYDGDYFNVSQRMAALRDESGNMQVSPDQPKAIDPTDLNARERQAVFRATMAGAEALHTFDAARDRKRKVWDETWAKVYKDAAEEAAKDAARGGKKP